jgi:hypothetical protein
VLQFVESFSNEENYSVWLELLKNLNFVSNLVLNTDYSEKFSAYMRNLLKPILNKLGLQPVEGESTQKKPKKETTLNTEQETKIHRFF